MEKYIGKVLNDRYMITEVIGVGGMAYVFKAFDKVCNRVVAVKILKDEFMSDAQFRRRFTNESKAITMLSHNNIVDVYDVSLEGDALYIVMEYIDGITLKEYMEKKGILSDNEALHFIKQILKGLAHAHERGIVHRDIKPHNILLLKDGTIKITDFGIARLTKFDTQTISDMTIGSVHYISPEQASGDRTDERSDIYSMGIILYEMLTGKLPFEADTAVAVALMQVQAQPEIPTVLNAEIKQGLEDIILKSIMKDPAIRYQSAAAFLADISLYEMNPDITFDYSSAVDEEISSVDEDNSPTIFASDLLSQEGREKIGDESADDIEEVEPKSPFMSTWFPILAGMGTAFILLIIVALGIVFQKELFGSKKVKCPNVIGMTLEEAKEGYTFSFVVGSEEESSKPKGEIISQKPAADSQIKKDGEITVVISKGESNDDENQNDEPLKDTNYVPGLVGMTKDDAIAELKRQNIRYKTKTDYSDTAKEGTVMSTYPKAGEEIEEDEVVTITISRGPEKVEEEPDEVETIVMPDLSNLTESAAKTTLKNNKLEIGTVKSEYHDTVEEGLVISQSVLKEVEVEIGTTIDIVISLGPENEENENNGETNQEGEENNPGDEPTDEPTDEPVDAPDDESTDEAPDSNVDTPADSQEDEENNTSAESATQTDPENEPEV